MHPESGKIRSNLRIVKKEKGNEFLFFIITSYAGAGSKGMISVQKDTPVMRGKGNNEPEFTKIYFKC